MTESTELIALRGKLAEIEDRIEGNRKLIERTIANSGDLSVQRSDCFKQIAKLLANQQSDLLKPKV